ncbi:MAG: glycosyltransferase, partial [Flavobacteriales bacterium]|nr:glycosyltransferase [Flavobacteriales bacterium]
MKKVLIITYYWPPSGGPGVQRWLRFVKHLRSFGWEPIVYIPENPSYVTRDENLTKEIPNDIEIISHPIVEPNRLFEMLSFSSKKRKKQFYDNQQQKGESKTWFQKILWYVRGNYFIPDARFLWISPSFRFLSKYLSENKVDLIVSTGPPHSAHLIAQKLKGEFNLPWVADFRDPWTSMDYLKEMDMSSSAMEKHVKMERDVIKGADKIVVVGRTMKNEFQENYGVTSEIIHNGYNEVTEVQKVELDKKFSICHIGSFLKNRNCNDLWQVLSEMAKKSPQFAKDLEIKLVGQLAPNVLASLTQYELIEFANMPGYVPFAETQQYLYGSQVLLLPIDRIENAEFVLTGKIFEYLKSNRPI